MFNKKKIKELEAEIERLKVEISEANVENYSLEHSVLQKETEYNDYAKRMGSKLAKKDREYNSLQKKYLKLLSNSIQRDAKTGRFFRVK